MKDKLPNFLIVGAAKCGTSSLHNYLNQHQDVFMPTYTPNGLKVKEPRFLIADKVRGRLSKGVWNYEDYRSLFTDVVTEKAIGESTVLYLYYFEEAIKNIKRFLGKEVKIIIMLRNPIERAYSAYLFASKTMQENQSFEEAINNSEQRFKEDMSLSPMILYKEMGLYYEMVKAYKANFNNIHIILYDDFVTQTNQEVDKVFEFLNLNKQEIDTNKIVNSGGMKWDSKIIKYLLMGEGSYRFALKKIIPKSFRMKIKRILISIFTSKSDNIKQSTYLELSKYFQKDISMLESLINKDLSKWLKI
ncbi:MAG: hypothetical protein CMD16_02145 [Flavobacteriales bacterium]|nr:hypothetical protein [Flavobacteriales bacterium]|tara:strand:- start:70491 stop:71399 length:909 start_codon:yes stop_codon:yes gene_type:complete